MNRPTGPRRVRAAALPVLLALAACRTTALPEPDPGPPLPPIATRVRHFAGSPLAGARGAVEPTEPSEDPGAAWRVRFGAARVDALPAEPLAPLGERVRLIAATRGDAPILATPPIARYARVGTGAAARALLDALAAGELGAAVVLPAVEGALLVGVTTELSLDALETAPSARGAIREHVALALHRPPAAALDAHDPTDAHDAHDAPDETDETDAHDAHNAPDETDATDATDETETTETTDATETTETDDVDERAPRRKPLEAWLEVEDVAAARPADPDDAAVIGAAPAPAEPVTEALGTDEPAAPPQLAHRVILELADAPAPGDVLVLVLPTPFDATGAGGYLVWAEVEAAPTAEAAAAAHARVVRRALADLAATERERVAELAPRPAGVLREREVAAAIDALLAGPRGRAMLVFLADVTDAPVAEDVALTASDADLAELVQRARAALRGAEAPREPDAVGWQLEREALAWLAARREAETLPPELLAVLIVHAGEAARQSGLVEDALARSADAQGLALALVEENRILLEDPSPGARVRAQRWLAERGLLPADYEAMAPKAERRAALVRAESLAAEQAARDAETPTASSRTDGEPPPEPGRPDTPSSDPGAEDAGGGEPDARGAESSAEASEQRPGDGR